MPSSKEEGPRENTSLPTEEIFTTPADGLYTPVFISLLHVKLAARAVPPEAPAATCVLLLTLPNTAVKLLSFTTLDTDTALSNALAEVLLAYTIDGMLSAIELLAYVLDSKRELIGLLEKNAAFDAKLLAFDANVLALEENNVLLDRPNVALLANDDELDENGAELLANAPAFDANADESTNWVTALLLCAALLLENVADEKSTGILLLE